jgi:AraC family L-rhamnose operon regulatory protein RhaS
MLRRRPELNITEIALSCGFQSSQYFATVFHRRTGLAPRQYRQAHEAVILPARE